MEVLFHGLRGISDWELPFIRDFPFDLLFTAFFAPIVKPQSAKTTIVKNCEHTYIEGYNIPEKSANPRPSLYQQDPVVLLFHQGGSVHLCCHGAARGDIPGQIRPGAAQIRR